MALADFLFFLAAALAALVLLLRLSASGAAAARRQLLLAFAAISAFLAIFRGLLGFDLLGRPGLLFLLFSSFSFAMTSFLILETPAPLGCSSF